MIFQELVNLFSQARGSEIKPESEISSHLILTSAISGLFHTRYLHQVVCTRTDNSSIKLDLKLS